MSGYFIMNLDKAFNIVYGTFEYLSLGLAVGALYVGMQILGGLSAIYTLGDSKIGLKLTDATARGDNYAVTLPEL